MPGKRKRWPEIVVTEAMVDAASDAVGYLVGPGWVLDALESVRGMSDIRIQFELSSMEARFLAQGGRNPDLADSIDEYRAALAARQVHERGLP